MFNIVEECVIGIVQAMHANARSKVCINGLFSEEFSVEVSVKQGPVLSSPISAIVTKALFRELWHIQ